MEIILKENSEHISDLCAVMAIQSFLWKSSAFETDTAKNAGRVTIAGAFGNKLMVLLRMFPAALYLNNILFTLFHNVACSQTLYVP